MYTGVGFSVMAREICLFSPPRVFHTQLQTSKSLYRVTTTSRRLFEYYYMYYSLAAHRRYSPSPHRVSSRNPAPRASGEVKYDIGAFAARETWEFINSIKIVIEHVSGWWGTELPSVNSGGGRTQTFSRLSAREGERNIL